MRKTKTFLDSGVIISAHRGEPVIRKRALSLLDDPKASYNKRLDEVSFYEAFFAIAEVQPVSKKLIETALSEATKWGLSAVDALHVAAAKVRGCRELYTTEGEGSHFFA